MTSNHKVARSSRVSEIFYLWGHMIGDAEIEMVCSTRDVLFKLGAAVSFEIKVCMLAFSANFWVLLSQKKCHLKN